jgi:pantoate--beta-alanine ligase
MQIVRSVSAMQRLSARWQAERRRVGFVPTMGYLHRGHLSLVHRARQVVGRQGKVVVSIYVNPTQFGPREDLSRYPRDLAQDAALCRAAAVDVIFAPSDREMYPREQGTGFSTFVVEENLSQVMEGKSRPTHFRGVATVVTKLFHIVLPQVAVFGAKDYQQAAIVKRMVRDLNFGVRVIVAPTVREPDGLAMSSRNKYLSTEQRLQARVLWRCIEEVRLQVRRSAKLLSANRLKSGLKRMIARESEARLDYIEFFDPATLDVLPRVGRGTQMALAVFVGMTRLIDNARI